MKFINDKLPKTVFVKKLKYDVNVFNIKYIQHENKNLHEA
jgi:hypothetical protein